MDISNIKYISSIIFTLATVAIVSMDLGVSYNSNEIKIYQNTFFQLLAVLSGIYLNSTDLRSGSIVFFTWLILKYYKIKFLDTNDKKTLKKSFIYKIDNI